MRAQANRLETSTHSLGECASGKSPGPKAGIVGIPAAANQGASVAAGKQPIGGGSGSILAQARSRAVASG